MNAESNKYTSTRASAYKRRAKRWLWKGRWPLRGAVHLVGPEGLGKGVFVAWLMAQLTLGKLPGEFFGTPIDVMLVSNEDDAEEDLIPRLEAAEADLDRVHVFVVKTPKGVETPATFPGDLDGLVNECKDTESKAVIIDPLLNHVSVLVEAQKDFAKTLQALTDLRSRLEQIDGCYGGVCHYSKNMATSSMLDRLLGSKALGTFPRAILGFGYDPADPEVRLVLQAKNNGGVRSPQMPTLAFTIHSADLGTDDEGLEVTAPYLKWEEDRPGIDPTEFFGLTGDEMIARDAAKDELLLALIDGQRPPKDVVSEVMARGKVSRRTVQRAYEDLVFQGLALGLKRGVRGEWELTDTGLIKAKEIAPKAEAEDKATKAEATKRASRKRATKPSKRPAPIDQDDDE